MTSPLYALFIPLVLCCQATRRADRSFADVLSSLRRRLAEFPPIVSSERPTAVHLHHPTHRGTCNMEATSPDVARSDIAPIIGLGLSI